MGPLALMAKQAGMEVFGTDLELGAVAPELRKAGIKFETGAQDGNFLEEVNEKQGIDWFVYTSALRDDHPELVLAKKLGIRTSKRDELIAYLVEKLGLKMVAVAGTHGKTTTTSMIIWTCLKLGLPISYLVGTTLPFAEAGKYDEKSEFLVYEADEYDRNFLHFFPWLSVITSVSYDHPDIYPTKFDYMQAFAKFEGQSENVIRGRALEGAAVQNNETLDFTEQFSLAGEARRYDANLAMQAVFEMAEEAGFEEVTQEELIKILDEFPGVGRRFERLADGVYTDYGHHPEEIAATVEMAKEEAERLGKKGVVVVYQPHQNTRQHEVRDGYYDAFSGVEKLYWLPTYLTRENPDLAVLSPQELLEGLENSEVGEEADMDEKLATALLKWQKEGFLVMLMSAGPADKWFRTIWK